MCSLLPVPPPQTSAGSSGISIPQTDQQSLASVFQWLVSGPVIFLALFFKIASFEKPRKFICEKFKITLDNHHRQVLTHAFETSVKKCCFYSRIHVDRTKNFYSSFAFSCYKSKPTIQKVYHGEFKVVTEM